MLDFVMDEYDVTIPLADLLFSDPYETLTEHVESGEYLGLAVVGGTTCHHLAFRQDEIDWQIWIDVGSPSLPRKIVITYRELRGQPQYCATLTEWNLSPRLPDDVFEFRPPVDARQVEMDALLGPDEGD